MFAEEEQRGPRVVVAQMLVGEFVGPLNLAFNRGEPRRAFFCGTLAWTRRQEPCTEHPLQHEPPVFPHLRGFREEICTGPSQVE